MGKGGWERAEEMRDRGIRLELESFCATALLCRCVGVVCVCVMCGWLVIAGIWPAAGQFPQAGVMYSVASCRIRTAERLLRQRLSVNSPFPACLCQVERNRELGAVLC